MNVLIACEFSGVVRNAFRALGHSAWSCDLLPTEAENINHHIQGDALEVIRTGRPTDGARWDLLIAHPPCTHLAVSGACWFPAKRKDGSQQKAIDFFLALCRASVPRICVENPVCIMSTVFRKPDQIVQPWMFGHTEQKTTCLWLKGLPKLIETKNVKAEMMTLPKNKRERLHYLPPRQDRWKERSRTFTGLATAMAQQWSS